MCSQGHDAFSAFFHEAIGSSNQCSTGNCEIINDQSRSPFNITDNLQDFRLLVMFPAFLVGNCQRSIQTGSISACILHKSCIRRHHHQLTHIMSAHCFTENGTGCQVINRYPEKALYLCGMKINGHHAVSTGSFDTISTDSGSDRHPGFVFLVSFGVTEIRHDHSD